MADCVWYLSKYFGLPANRTGSRAFMLLREFVKMGVHPVVFTANGNHLFTSREFFGAAQVERVDGVEICWLRLRKYGGARSFGRIVSWLEFEWKLWRQPKHDFPAPAAVIVSSLSLFTIFNGLLLKKRFGCRLIFEVRDIWPLTIVEEGGFSRYNPFVMVLQWIEQLAYRASDAIVGTMPNLAQHVREVAGLTAPVHCIPMGVAPEQLSEALPLPDDYAEVHIPKDKIIICHAGTIGQTNALEILFTVARQMQGHPHIHFLLVGDGDLKSRFQAENSDLANVSFAPAVSKDLVQSVLAHCHVTYFSTYPSKVWDYGLSLNKLIDYMLAGRPVIGSYSGYPSMLNESGGGTFVPAGDAEALRLEIMRLATLAAAKRKLAGQAGRAWVLANRQYSQLARDYLEIALPLRKIESDPLARAKP
jgi:glycosyltransferase involved in cell wall biosynthesis